LLLDEPTTGVDPRSRIDLWDAMRGLVEQGTNVLLTTQYLEEADHLADEIVIIDHGRTIAQGTPAELKKRAGRKVIEVHVRAREDVTDVANALQAIGDGDMTLDESTRRVSVVVDGSTEQLTRALRPLEERGITLEDVALRPPRLDEVFLALTDRPPDSEPVDDAVASAGAAGVVEQAPGMREETRHG
jgi:ABC-2 type transport system ATP-binding protein